MDQNKLYGLLAEAVVLLNSDTWDHSVPSRSAAASDATPIRMKAGAQGSYHALSAFACGDVFQSLGVAKGDACYWQFTIDGDKVSDFVASRLISDRSDMPSFEKLVETWLWCADHFGMISTSREPFLPHPDMKRLMHAFTDQGYARKFGNYFLWSDAMAPVMQAACFWTSANISYSEIYEREIDLDLAAAAKSVPDDVLRAARQNKVLEVYSALCNRWCDGAWLANPPLGQVSLFGGVERVHRFIEMIVQHGRPDATQ